MVSFDRQLDPQTVPASDFSVTGPGGESVPVDSAAVDNAAEEGDPDPQPRARPDERRTRATVDTDVKSWAGDRPPAATSWTFTTGQGTTPRVSSRTPASDATAVATDATVRATFDRAPGAPHGDRRDGGASPGGGGAPLAARVDYLPGHADRAPHAGRAPRGVHARTA